MKTTINNHLIFFRGVVIVISCFATFWAQSQNSEKRSKKQHKTHEMIFAETKCWVMMGETEKEKFSVNSQMRAEKLR